MVYVMLLILFAPILALLIIPVYDATLDTVSIMENVKSIQWKHIVKLLIQMEFA